MGQGASKTTSSSIYTDEINKTVCNDKFEKKKEKEGVNHNDGYYRKYLRDSSDYLRLTRNPEAIKGESTGVRFHSLVKRYEENNNICLRQISKEELVFKLKEYIETTNSILRIKDDSRQFLSYKFEYDDIIRLYLYKAFYPSVFDYDIVQANGNENIVFKSSYIKENIGVIQQQIEILLWTISYDAIAIAISNQAYEQISSSKKYNATIRCDITANEIKEDIEVEVKTPRKKIPSIKLIKFFVPSIVYGAD